MNFAIVGCQHTHIKIFIDEMIELGHRFLGIYDSSEYFLAEKYAQDYNVPLFDSLAQLLDQDPAIIGNCADNEHKIDVIEWCEQHHLHVMTDKPIVKDFAGLQRLRNVAARGSIQLGMMLTERYERHLYTLKQMIDQDELGDIVDFTFLKPHKLIRDQRPKWFFEKSINGGLIIDLMIHDVDLLGWFCNDRPFVSYEGKLVKTGFYDLPEFYDNAQLNIVLEGAITASLRSDWHMPTAFNSWGDGRIFVAGSKGRVEIRSAGDVFGEPGPFISFSTHTNKAERIEAMQVPYNLTEDFLRKINKQSHSLPTESMIRCNELVLQMDAVSTKWVRS